MKSPFHRGEQAVQARYGVREKLASIGKRVIRSYMPDQHRGFFAGLPFILVGHRDDEGRPWASMLYGEPGFISSPSPTLLDIAADPIPGDPLTSNLCVGAGLGLLGIELHSRRRNRISGRLEPHAKGIRVRVDQSFGNCPKYIQARALEIEPGHPNPPEPAAPAAVLDEEAREMLGAADTFFIASAHEVEHEDGVAPTAGGVDVSHRGGMPGFVTVLDERHFSFPDYSGNYYFNTVGNLIENPRSGFLFPDFTRGDLLLMTGETRVVFEPGEVVFPPGAKRVLVFALDEMIRIRRAMPYRWTFLETSRHLDFVS